MHYNNILPKEYLLRRGYRTVEVPDVILSDLEKAVIGYVSLSTSFDSNGRLTRSSASYQELHELIFEYLKLHSPDEIHKLLDSTLSRLKSNLAKNPHVKQKETIQDQTLHFSRLLQENPKKIKYVDFAPKGLGQLLSPSSYTPFSRYCNRIIQKLVREEVFVKSDVLGTRYVVLNPYFPTVNRKI